MVAGITVGVGITIITVIGIDTREVRTRQSAQLTILDLRGGLLCKQSLHDRHLYMAPLQTSSMRLRARFGTTQRIARNWKRPSVNIALRIIDDLRRAGGIGLCSVGGVIALAPKMSWDAGILIPSLAKHLLQARIDLDA